MAEMNSLFDPEAFGAGGFLDDVDCVITEARVVSGHDTPMRDTDAVSRCFMKIVYQPDAEGSDSREEYYAMGPLEKFVPSKDGTRVVYEPGTKINKNSKTAMFFGGLINAGFPKAQLPADGNVTFLEHLHCHVNAVPMPEMRSTTSKFTPPVGADGKPKQATVVIITKILETLVGTKAQAQAATSVTSARKSKAVAAGKPNGAAEGEPVPTPANVGDAEGATIEAILGLLLDKSPVPKKLLPTEMMTRITDAKLRTASFKLIGNPEWLGSDDRPWAFDPGKGELSAL